MSETNPFRMSMLNRSNSSLDQLDPQPSDPHQAARFSFVDNDDGFEASAPSPQNTQFFSNTPTPSPPLVRNNPFQVDLSESGNQPIRRIRTNDDPLPPSYDSVNEERSSFPSAEDEKRSAQQAEDRKKLEADENYRRGYEEGMRVAKEQERRKRHEMRRRRHERLEREGSRPTRSASTNNGGSGTTITNGGSGSGHGHGSGAGSGSGSGGKHRLDRSVSTHDKPKKPGQNSLDVIDKLDVTGVFSGSGFHHDGPFDACAPHRNKGNSRLATPISAFPADGPNNSLAVENPEFASYRTAENVYGRHADIPPEVAQNSFDPTDRGTKVHGERTMALGSTTFLDGTPASRDAIAANEEKAQNRALGRSKSVLRPKQSTEFDGQPKSLLSRVKSLRVTRH